MIVVILVFWMWVVLFDYRALSSGRLGVSLLSLAFDICQNISDPEPIWKPN